jgi:hypothetical protein
VSNLFGYISVNPEMLNEQAQERYRSYYCGLCRTLKERHGNLGRVTLSYDMTFLLILLSSLYEPAERNTAGRCAAHPLKRREHTRNTIADYAADMNIALAFHKGKDDWADDRSKAGLARVTMLRRAYQRVEALYPQKCAHIARCLCEIGHVERRDDLRVDPAADLTASMLGEIFVYHQDMWQTPLRKMGEGLGRFIYVMDAYEDLPEDAARHRYNPLIPLRARNDFETLCREGLMMMMSECAQAFEVLPLERDMDILKNVLYGGVWRKFALISEKREKEARSA